ncbi:hypothetical protein [Mycobacterium avium]|uniref:hypothetical protein n=1 Tax=Mycobacterium avium TaxID=1764 RepID=UPI0003D216B4|nr:hypothetical protein [Mycobacterium avium]ETA89991.1 hypothetical protein O984_24600 [Mycobacterium avium 05-4293]ETZ41183.1 hypothetical protein L837_5138 [Mycobacterium avium MAV_061107_1842]MBZ4523143.1 hypothetical protein [Mycobacterium avium subsp. hominissuis]MBZ4526701.1 hypothetical protein [Mycobacterium avium subsp. hominissuis]MBZ4532988.1 hypothetical protein [Mycobacterium avium subsp. hominissuis]
MGNKAVSKEARRAAREAAAAAQEEIIRRTKANVEDLAAFFDARDRADAVDVWLAERQQVLAEQAAQRRCSHRRQCGTALRAMRDRGETLREIARMAGISEKAVRELIRETESPEAPADPGQAPADGVAGTTPAPRAERLAATGVVPGGGPADDRSWEPVSARA